MQILYIADELVPANFEVSVYSNHRYWGYKTIKLDGESGVFNSYMLVSGSLEQSFKKVKRLLDVDRPLYLPINLMIRVNIAFKGVIVVGLFLRLAQKYYTW
jgi:hypothetical protein